MKRSLSNKDAADRKVQPIFGLDLKINSVLRQAVGDSLVGPTCSLPVPLFFNVNIFLNKRCSVNSIA